MRDLIRERTNAGLAAVRARGRKGGRPSVMTPDKLAIAREMYASGEHTVAAIAAVVGVSRASVYRYLAPSDGPSPAGDAAAPEPGAMVALSELSEQQRDLAQRRFEVLRPHLEDGVALAHAAAAAGIPARTARHWLARFRVGGYPVWRGPRGVTAIPAASHPSSWSSSRGWRCGARAAQSRTINRQAVRVAGERGWPVLSYGTVRSIVVSLDPGLVALAHDGPAGYRDRFELVFRREAAAANAIWQADVGHPKRPTSAVRTRPKSAEDHSLRLRGIGHTRTPTPGFIRPAIYSWTDCGACAVTCRYGRCGGPSVGEELSELIALALCEAADRLGRRDPAAAEQLVDLHGPVLRQGEQEVCDLRGQHERRRVGQYLVERATAALEVALELRALPAHRRGTPKRILALRERARRRHRLGCKFAIVWRSDPPTLPTQHGWCVVANPLVVQPALQALDDPDSAHAPNSTMCCTSAGSAR
jgi:hypothetical protein